MQIASPTAPAVTLDIRTLKFSDGHERMRKIALKVLEMGKSVSVYVKIKPKSCLPSRNAVDSAIIEVSDNPRKNLSSKLLGRTILYGCAFTVDRVHLKGQGKHFCCKTLHHLDIDDKRNLKMFSFQYKVQLLFSWKSREQLMRKTLVLL